MHRSRQQHRPFLFCDTWMSPGLAVLIALVFFPPPPSFSQWVPVSDVSIRHSDTGRATALTYTLSDPDISSQSPVYVFIRSSPDGGRTWKPVPEENLQGDGHGIVESPGHKTSELIAVKTTAVQAGGAPEFRVRAVKMVKIPAGEFISRNTPPGADDMLVSRLPDYYIARYETTLGMYADYLNETGGDGAGWNTEMSDEVKSGIIQEGSPPDFTYRAAPGRENYPATYISWNDARAFAEWCGLRLPSEAEFEKAFRGGLFLDGDRSRKRKNPAPERKYPWGDEDPDYGGIHRCNFDGDDDGFPQTAPVGSFAEFNSPYGISDLAGNVAEWTSDWHSTTYHVGLDGYRMVQGGSWMNLFLKVYAVTGATPLPVRERGIMGFRVAK